MNTTTRNRTPNASRWTQRLLASLSCLAIVGCGGGSDGSSAPGTQAAAPTQLLASQTVTNSSAAAITPDRYNRVVHQLYLAFYGRPPDPASLAQYSQQLSTLGVQPNLNALVSEYQKNNAKVRALIDGFAASAESKSMYSANTRQFITQLYRTLLGRTPDTGGVDFWSDAVDSGKLPRALAALAVMSGAAVNNADAAAIDHKLQASSQFTAQVEQKALSSAYLTSAAILAARSMIDGVTSGTDQGAIDTTVASSITMLEPPQREGSLGTIAPDAITDVRLQNLSLLAQSNVPFTFGQVFIEGDLSPSERLIGRLSDGSTIALQMDVKATHPNGSVRHAIISGVLPSLLGNETKRMDLLKGMASSGTVTPAKLPADFSSRVEIVLDGVQYSASLADAVKAGPAIQWLTGPVVSESIVTAPLKNAAGTAHPHLTARFAVRSYAAVNQPVRVDLTVENNRTFTAAPRNLTYAVKMFVGAREAFSQNVLNHYHHARWHKVLWSGDGAAPTLHVRHHTDYLIASKAVSNYDRAIVPPEKALVTQLAGLTADKLGPMKIGPLIAYMPTTGGRPDIGPLPSWTVVYLLTMDPRARESMMAAADGSGSWSIHYRDDNTGFPIRLDNAVNKSISTHMNLAHKGPLPVPRCANNDKSLCWSPYTPDTAHQPSLAYVPYLLTGDYFYLEELQFWAAFNPTETDPALQGNGLGLVRWQQLRGQAWSLRTLGQTAYITPDSHYMKGYFNTMLDNNLNFYHDTYVVKNPNALGVYDGTGQGSFAVTQSAPWQDDFFTWSFGYLSELGYSKAEPILKWKAKYAVGRMTAPGYCFVEGAAYFLKYRDSNSTPIYSSFAQLYAANFTDKTVIDDASHILTHPTGASYLNLACGSQAQADWRSAATKTTWQARQMVGYATSNMGYPANMQIALAVAATSGIPNAELAWSTFASRSAKPNYTWEPQFAIVPR